MINNERPGVYTSYTVSKSRYVLEGAYIPGVAAMGSGETDEVYTVSSIEQANTLFGAASNMTKLIRILMESGVYTVKAAPLAQNTTAAYEAAFALLAADETIKAIVCDSTSTAVHSALKTAILSADARAQHKLGIVESSANTVQGYVSAAGSLNCERMILCAPSAVDYEGTAMITGALSASVCGAIVTKSDPALPLNGAKLMGIGGVATRFTDGEITTLVRGGVTPVETCGGETTVIRGITTKTTEGGVADATWREINTVLIIDDVIPTVRDALKKSFLRAKNTAQTRGAIRSCVVVELEKKVKAEIIESYDNITVAADTTDPTVCNVTFDFTIVHGINKICLTAYITV